MCAITLSATNMKSPPHFLEIHARGCRAGVRQGVFRPDVNYPVTIEMVRVQMESLKRMEEFFPAGISIGEALGTIGIGFLRSIASSEGMECLDRISPKFVSPHHPADSSDNEFLQTEPAQQ